MSAPPDDRRAAELLVGLFDLASTRLCRRLIGYPDHTPGVCLLPRGHKGDHAYVAEDEILRQLNATGATP